MWTSTLNEWVSIGSFDARDRASSPFCQWVSNKERYSSFLLSIDWAFSRYLMPSLFALHPRIVSIRYVSSIFSRCSSRRTRNSSRSPFPRANPKTLRFSQSGRTWSSWEHFPKCKRASGGSIFTSKTEDAHTSKDLAPQDLGFFL